MTSSGAPLSRAFGLGFRSELAADLVLAPRVVDFVEVVAEACFSQRSTRKEALALGEIWPVVPHGVKLSLGSPEGIDERRLDRLAALARELRAPMVSEHVSFTRAGGREIGHLTQLPRTREALRVVARNVAHARAHLPDIPLLLENVAASFAWPSDDEEMDEGTFYREVAGATGCPLLLDVGNLYANAVNARLDPSALMESFPLDRVAMLHVAGGVHEGGFYFDTHAHPVPDAVFDLVGAFLERFPDVPVLLERDANFGAFAELEREARRLRALRPDRRATASPTSTSTPTATPTSTATSTATSTSTSTSTPATSLAAQLSGVARLLCDREMPGGALADRIGVEALVRARGVLSRKRVDDALPLLGRLSRRIHELRPLAERTTEENLRPVRGAGPADALRIAEAAAREPALRDDALVDRLLLRARFAGPDAAGVVTPRVAPFFGSETLGDGTRLRAFKSFGAFASVSVSSPKP